MTRKASIAARLPVRRGLDEGEAAVYLSLSPSFFRTLVDRGAMPQPRLIGSRSVWDIDELDRAFWAMPRRHAPADQAGVEALAGVNYGFDVAHEATKGEPAPSEAQGADTWADVR